MLQTPRLIRIPNPWQNVSRNYQSTHQNSRDIENMVGRVGIEPTTKRLRVSCSTS